MHYNEIRETFRALYKKYCNMDFCFRSQDGTSAKLATWGIIVAVKSPHICFAFLLSMCTELFSPRNPFENSPRTENVENMS